MRWFPRLILGVFAALTLAAPVAASAAEAVNDQRPLSPEVLLVLIVGALTFAYVLRSARWSDGQERD